MEHTEQFKPVAVRAVAAMGTQPGEQGDGLLYRVTSFVQLVQPGLKAGQDSQENMPSSMPEVKCHPTIRTKICLATSDGVGTISSHQGKTAAVAWKVQLSRQRVCALHTRQLRVTHHDDVPVIDDCQLKQRDCIQVGEKTDNSFIHPDLLYSGA